MGNQKFDVVVVGGGPGGYVAAIRAGQLGMSVACVENKHLGGICLNWGCIPTKSLLRNAELYRTMLDHGEELGFTFDNLSFDLEKVIGRSRNVAGTLSNGISSLFKKNKVTHIQGTGRLFQRGMVQVTSDDGSTEMIEAKHIILATGARPRELPFAPFDGERIINYKDAMVPKTLPKEMVIIGAGAIGVEFAYFYNAFGTKVTLVEMQSRLVPVEDSDSSKELEKAFKKSGIKVKTNTKVSAISVTDKGVTVNIEGAKGKEETLQVDRVLVAAGVVGNVEELGLETLGVKTERDRIVVDGSYRTNVDGVYAIGDVVGAPWLAHVASAEGICCVERIAGHERPDVPYESIPGCTYCQPEIASVGQTEDALKEAGTAYKVGRFPFRASGKAIAAHETTGFVKVLFGEEYGDVLGAHLVGHGATEMIHELVLARTLEATEKDILHTVHAHPTLSEGIHEAVGNAYGESINI